MKTSIRGVVFDMIRYVGECVPCHVTLVLHSVYNVDEGYVICQNCRKVRPVKRERNQEEETQGIQG